MRVNYKLFSLLLFFLLFSSAFASMDETGLSDSIEKMLGNISIADTTKINRLLEVSDLIADQSPVKAKEYGLKAVELARNLNDTSVLYNTLGMVGYDQYSGGMFNDALNYFLESERIALILKDSLKLATVYLNLGAVYDEMGDYQKTMDYYLRSLSFHEALNDSVGLAYCFVNLGVICDKYEQEKKAISYLNNAIGIATALELNDLKYSCENNLGLLYYGENKFDSALIIYYDAIATGRQIDAKDSEPILISNIGLVYMAQDNYLLAEEKFLLAYKKSLLFPAKTLQNTIKLNLAELYLVKAKKSKKPKSRKLFHKSVDFALSTLDFSSEHSNFNNEMYAYEILTEAYKGLANYKESYNYQAKYIKLLKQSSVEEKNRELELLSSKYKAEKQSIEIEKLAKENQVEKLKSDNQKLYLIISVVMVIASLLIAIALYRLYRAKTKNLKELDKKNIEINKLITELEASNKVKDKFFSIIAHDLKNPFSVLMGMSDLLKNSIDNLQMEDIKEFAGMINSASTDTYELLTELLEWSRLQTKSIKPQPVKINVSTEVKNSIKLLGAQAEKKGLELNNNIERGTFVFADRKMFNTILRNLISNSIKFTSSGSITITSVKDEFVKISVADTGIGIAKENLSKLFRVDEMFTTKGTSKETGTGLGLILCKEMVELNGGKISVESQEGKGTKFTISLPTV